MTHFDFDKTISREGTASEKHEQFREFNAIPMWVADTDFKSPDIVQEAIAERTRHGIFGYTGPSESLQQSVQSWLKAKYAWDIEKEWIYWLPGVVPGFNLSILALTSDTDAVAVQTPNYPPLLNAPILNNRERLLIETYESEGRWHLNMTQLEQQFRQKNCSMFVMCNPMNPCGTRLNLEELEHIVSLAKQHNVQLCSDEIHCDLLLDPSIPHIPLGKIDDNAITIMAASKTFNIAGLSCSLAIIKDPAVRAKLAKKGKGLVSTPNLLGFTATEAAFTGGADWLDAQMAYLNQNLEFLIDYLPKLPGLKMLKPEATFLAWIDCRETGLEDPFQHFLDNGVALSNGKDFGMPGFVRLNFGCPMSQLEAALDKMRQALN